MTIDYGHWVLDVPNFDPDNWFGFLYCIKSNIDGRLYIGKKFFKSKKRAKPLKGKKRSRISFVDSNWKTYRSSSKELQADIEKYGEDKFTFTIIQLCSGKCELTYSEESYQFQHNVLSARQPDGTRLYYNGNVGTKCFKGIERQQNESAAKLSGLQSS